MGAHVSPLLLATLKFAAIKCLIQSFLAEIIIILASSMYGCVAYCFQNWSVSVCKCMGDYTLH